MKKLTIIMAMLAAIVLAGCNEKTNEPVYPEQEMYVGDVFQITNGETGWFCDVENVAIVEANYVTALHVGEAKVRNAHHYFRIKVIPRHTEITDPYLQWGASKAMVKYSVKAKLKKETETDFYFDALGKESETIYTFDAMGALSKVRINVSNVQVAESVVKSYLGERYVKKYESTEGEKKIYTYKSVEGKSNIIFTTYVPSSPLYGSMTIEYTGV